MAKSKAPLFDKTAYALSLWNKARSHPARILIMDYLVAHGLTPFAELCKRLPLARSTVSQHMRTLLREGVVKLHEEYPHSFYQLNPKLCEAFARISKSMNDPFLHPRSTEND